MVKLHLHLKQAKGKLGKKHVAVLSILLALKILGLFSFFLLIPPPLDVITDFFFPNHKICDFCGQKFGKILDKFFF
jgi:hypothetical protein